MLASLAACGSETPSAETTASTDDTAATAVNTPADIDSLEARKLIDDELPEKDFGGEKFLILGETLNKDDMEAAESTGDIVLDAVYKRNRMIEDNPGISHCGISGENFAYFTGANQQYTMFPNGQVIFTTGIVGAALKAQFRDMKDDFGILP